jgi:hypothetical protein
VTFFGGKMLHSFENSQGLFDGDDAQNYIPLLKDEARDALVNGQWFYKIDGSNGLLVFNDESKTYDIFRRYDDKKDKFKNGIPDGYINLPPSRNMDTYDSESASHKYYQQFIPRPAETTKGKEAALWRTLYAQVDKAHIEGRLNGSDGVPAKYHSIELVGKNFAGTPGVEGVGIALHSAQVMEKPSESPKTDLEWFEYFHQLFRPDGLCHEGIIISWNGLSWKIRAEWFRKDSAWKTRKNTANAPVMI